MQSWKTLIGAGVTIDFLTRVGVPAGRADVQLTPDGETSIIVMALANHQLLREHALSALEEIQPSLVLAQLEVPDQVTIAVAR